MTVQPELDAKSPVGAETFRAVFEVSNDGMVIVDRHARFRVWNSRLAELFGAPSTLRDPDAMQRHIAAQLEDGPSFLAEIRTLAADPTTCVQSPLRCRDGRILDRCSCVLPMGRLWSFHDVTEHVRVERALRESEERYRDLYNKTPVMMHSIDPSGAIVSVSDAWLDKLGYERAEVLGRRSVEFLTPASRRYALEHVLPAFFETGVVEDVHYQVEKRAGGIVDVLLSAIAERAPDGTVARSLAVLIDVTERLRAERERDRALADERAARAASEEALALLDTVFRSAPVGLAFLDRELRYVRINDVLAALHAVTPEATIGRTIWEIAPEVAPRVAPILRRVMLEEQPVTSVAIDAEVRAVPGEVRSYLAGYYPVRAGSSVVGAGVVVVDVTDQKRAAVLQARLYREAQEALRLRDDFLAVAAHELRTPMTPLSMSLQIVERDAHAGRPADLRIIERALRQLDKLSALVEDILESSKVQLGLVAVRREPISFSAVVAEAVRSERAVSALHTVELRSTDEPLVVTGDRVGLARVVHSLLDNAMKYSAAGSTIAVSLERVAGEARLSVADRGIGIPSDELPRLFNRFFRARNAPVTQYGGFGLDLYISRHIVELHGGRVWAQSRLGEGSTFFVALPLAARV